MNLTPAQTIAVRELVASGSVIKAAKSADVSERSVRRWLGGTDFQNEYRIAARSAASEAVTALLAAQGEAVRALREALVAESPATRVRAARALLETGARAYDDDLDQRLQDLERQATAWQYDVPHGLTVV